MLDHNCAVYTLKPANTVGAPAEILPSADQPYTYLLPAINNSVITQSSNIACQLQLNVADDNTASISGCIHADENAKILPIAIKAPELYLKKLIPILLQKNQITLDGSISERTAPANTTLLLSHPSKPVRLLVNEMLKNSDNFIANTLLKTLGANYFKQQGTWENGVNAVQTILTQQTKIDFTKAVFVDGDGASRYDLITPAQISGLLNFIYHDFALNPEFIAALPIAGVDGTLTKRMVNENILVRAKTGTMSGVSSLSGYVETANHQILSFVILTNNHIGSEKQVEKLEDQIAEFLAKLN